jgi:hypothetical protein
MVRDVAAGPVSNTFPNCESKPVLPAAGIMRPVAPVPWAVLNDPPFA